MAYMMASRLFVTDKEAGFLGRLLKGLNQRSGLLLFVSVAWEEGGLGGGVFVCSTGN